MKSIVSLFENFHTSTLMKENNDVGAFIYLARREEVKKIEGNVKCLCTEFHLMFKIW